jgi:hypothetical protein
MSLDDAAKGNATAKALGASAPDTVGEGFKRRSVAGTGDPVNASLSTTMSAKPDCQGTSAELPMTRPLRDTDLKLVSALLPSLKLVEDHELFDAPQGLHQSLENGRQDRVEGGGVGGGLPAEEEGYTRRLRSRSAGSSWLETIKETMSYEQEDLGC